MLRCKKVLVIPLAALLIVMGYQDAALADGAVVCDDEQDECDLGADDGGDPQPSDDDDGDSGGSEHGDEVAEDCTVDNPEACVSDPQVVPIVGQLAERARGHLVLPEPALAVSPPTNQIVNLPVWLAVSEDSWQPRSASVSAGAVTVTATASPSHVRWLLGDGAEVFCYGPGTRWEPGMNPKAESPDCGHTYTRTSTHAPNDEFEVEAAVFWEVTWEASTGQSGAFEGLSTETSTSWPVVELQSLISG